MINCPFNNFSYGKALVILVFILFGCGLLVNAQEKKPRIKANIINEHLEGKGDLIKFDSLKTTKGKGIMGCVSGLSYTYKVKSNNYVPSGETMLPYLDDGIANIVFTNTSDFNLYFTVTIKGVYDKGINVQCLGKSSTIKGLERGGSSPLGFGVILSASESGIVVKIDKISKNKYIEKDGQLTYTADEKLSCDFSFTIKLPPALKPLEIVEADTVVKIKDNKEDDFWKTGSKKEENAPDANKKKELNANDDFWNGTKPTDSKNKTEKANDDFWSGNGKKIEANKTKDDFWNGSVDADMKVNYKAKCSGSNKCGYLNEKNEMVIDYIYNVTYDFKENLGRVGTTEGYGFVNKKGQKITKEAFKDARDFFNGMAAVKQNDKWGFINKSGQIVVPCIYNEVGNFNNDLAYVTINDNKLEAKPNGGCDQDYYVLLKTISLINKSNVVLQKEKKYEVLSYPHFHTITLTRETYYKTDGERRAAEREAERNKELEENNRRRCVEEERNATENLKRQAESAGYKLLEKK